MKLRNLGMVGIAVGAAFFVLHPPWLKAQAPVVPAPPAHSRDAVRFVTPRDPHLPVLPGACRFLTPLALADAPYASAPNPDASLPLTALQTPQKGESDRELRFPTQDHLFRVESEEGLRQRLRRELPNVKNVLFPRDEPFLPEVTTTEAFPGQQAEPIAGLICYRPLYFEDKRAERLGKYVPYLQPLVSASRFYFDFILLPCRMLAFPPWTYECDSP